MMTSSIRKSSRADRCENCRFYGGSTCRRHPPVIDKDDSAWSAWPSVGLNGWCGEFAPKKQGV